MQPPPRTASNMNAAAVRFIRAYSGRCALGGRWNGPNSGLILGSGTPATLNKTGKLGTTGIGAGRRMAKWGQGENFSGRPRAMPEDRCISPDSRRDGPLSADRHGEANAEGRPAPRRRFKIDRAAVFLDDPLRDEEAQAGPLLLGGEIGLEDSRSVGGVDAGAVVADRDFQAILYACRGHFNQPAFLGRVDCVQDEIEDHLH